MSRFEALALAKARFGNVFERPAFEPWQVPAGLRVKRSLDDGVVLLEGDSDADRQLVESMGMPLTSELGSGQPEPVDLALEPAGEDGFSPRNPVVPIRIGGPGRVSFPRSGTAISLAEAAPEVPLETNGRVFYANALEDLDMAVTPTPGGVSFSFSVRSAEAPEQATLDFELPPGVTLQPSQDLRETVDLVRGGELVGRVLPPAGWDADGEPVPVDYDIDGQRLEVRFPHREQDLRYPLYIDPDYNDFGSYLSQDWGEWYTRWKQPGSGGTQNWGFRLPTSTTSTLPGAVWSGYLVWDPLESTCRHASLSIL